MQDHEVAPMQQSLLLLAAAVFFVTAGDQLTGLQPISGGLTGERRGLIRAAWVIVAVDWIVVGAIWLAVGLHIVPQAVALWTAPVPLAAAMMLVVTMGLRFPGVWMLGTAGLLGSLSGLV